MQAVASSALAFRKSTWKRILFAILAVAVGALLAVVHPGSTKLATMVKVNPLEGYEGQLQQVPSEHYYKKSSSVAHSSSSNHAISKSEASAVPIHSSHKKSLSHVEQKSSNEIATDSPPPLYKNLSCPFEWSKYSCFHQGRRRQARISYSLASKAWRDRARYHATEYWSSPYFNSMSQNSKLVLVGDSTMRQIFVALSCQLWIMGQIEDYQVDWRENWPCHGTRNCIQSGNHSGFDVGWVRVKQGGPEIFFLPIAGSLAHQQPSIVDPWIAESESQQQLSFQLKPPKESSYMLTEKDVIVYNIGLHMDIASREGIYKKLDLFGRSLLKRRKDTPTPTWVITTTITQHFQTKDGMWKSNPLGEEVVEKAPNGCRESVPYNPRKKRELEVFHEGQNVDLLLNIEDEKMGQFHIHRGDCTHYCLAGPPDIFALQLLDRLAQHYGGNM